MRMQRWVGLGVAIVVVAAVTVSLFPSATAGLASLVGAPKTLDSTGASEPNWNAGNLCYAYGIGTTKVLCVSTISNAREPLTYNFSAGELLGGTVNVWIYGSNDCVYLNFHSFYTTINIHLLGTGYACKTPKSSGGGGGGNGWDPAVNLYQQPSCSSSPGFTWTLGVLWNNQQTSCAPGINIAVNSEGDVVNLIQFGSPCQTIGDYTANVTVYGTTTVVHDYQNGNNLHTTVTYIGTTAGFATCPSGITVGRVSWTVKSYGNKNEFSTIFVDGTNVAHAPPNQSFKTQPLGPPDGVSYGFGNLYGSETTQVTPAGSCQYIAA